MRVAKYAQDGFSLQKLLTPGVGQTGALGKLSLGLGAASQYKQMKELPKLQAKSLDLGIDAQRDILDRAATMPTINRLGLDQALKDAEGSEEKDASTLATLIDSGMSPEAAAEQLSTNKMQRESQVSGLLSNLDSQQNRMDLAQKSATDAAYGDLRKAELTKDQFDLMGQAQANIKGGFDFATLLQRGENLFNPQATTQNTTTTNQKTGERGIQLQGGGITPGEFSHDTNNLIIAHENGEPALDVDGDEMHVTGDEAILPPDIFEPMMEAAFNGDKEKLFDIFVRKVASQQRFQ